MWKAHRFLWWMAATMLGIFPESLAYDRKLAVRRVKLPLLSELTG